MVVKNHDGPKSQFSKHANVPIITVPQLCVTKSRNRKYADHHGHINHDVTESRDHKIAHIRGHSWKSYHTFQLQIQIVDGILTNNVNTSNCTELHHRLQRCLRITRTATSTATLDKFISHQMSIAVQNIRTPFRDE